jgi:uncharacterized protein YdeI (YjbR/CyaY-like superfamily)
MNPKVDKFIRKEKKWQAEFEKLRTIVLDCQLDEELKWGKPCYTFQQKNVVIVQGFKEYCALMFFKGALLHDTKRVLNKIGNTQAARQIRFTSVREIVTMASIVKSYIHEAIEIEQAGVKVQLKNTSEFIVPEEFQKRLIAMPALKTSFGALTPGRQRAYIYHFSQPKQTKTRESRIEKCIPQILRGKGLND